MVFRKRGLFPPAQPSSAATALLWSWRSLRVWGAFPLLRAVDALP
jgi:hypothetical protein